MIAPNDKAITVAKANDAAATAKYTLDMMLLLFASLQTRTAILIERIAAETPTAKPEKCDLKTKFDHMTFQNNSRSTLLKLTKIGWDMHQKHLGLCSKVLGLIGRTFANPKSDDVIEVLRWCNSTRVLNAETDVDCGVILRSANLFA